MSVHDGSGPTTLDFAGRSAPTLESVIWDMKNCQQAPGVSVLQHGIAVRRAYRDIMGHILDGKALPDGWRIPSWVYEPSVAGGQLDDAILSLYQVYHDCGKPFVMVTDDNGRNHFPNHARASGIIWRAIGGSGEVARLMEMDMDAHLLTADGIAEFASRPQAPSLLLTALAEVHANAEMFGGLQSDSFKIKAKHLAKRGRQVLNSPSQKTTVTL